MLCLELSIRVLTRNNGVLTKASSEYPLIRLPKTGLILLQQEKHTICTSPILTFATLIDSNQNTPQPNPLNLPSF